MRRVFCFTGGLTVTALLAAASLLGTSTASATVNVPERTGSKSASGQAYTSTGQIRPADNAHWCLTAAAGANPGDPLFVLPCVKGARDQTWFAYRTPGTGQINLATRPDALVGQRGSASWNAVIIYSLKPTAAITLIGYTSYSKGWLLDIKKGEIIRFLTVPSHLTTTKMSVVRWGVASSSSKKSQEWLFAAWKELES